MRPDARDRLLGWLLIALALAVVVGPFVWIFITSLKQQIAIYAGSWIFEPTLSNYRDVLFSRRSDFLANTANSLAVAGVSTALVLTVGTLAAYSLHRFRWSGAVRNTLLAWTIAFHAMPVLALLGPWYLAFQKLGLYDTLTALVLVHIALNLPMTTWLMMAFFKDVPIELEEAALVDGCRRMDAFFRISLPLAVPGLVAAGVLAFVFSWNEFAVALNLTSSDTATVPVAIARFAQQYEIQHGQMAAASMLSAVPAILLMAFGQRFVVRGLTLGAVK